MVDSVNIGLWALAAIVAVPLLVLTMECLSAALRPGGTEPTSASEKRSRCGVLIPAHDEEVGLPRTLADIQPQLRERDRLLVVADNCRDATAAIARNAGAEVVERRDDARRGKGYALAAGVEHLRADPPDVVIVIDADCRLPPGAIDRLVETTAECRRPVQAGYELALPAGASPRARLSELAFRWKNCVRPLGLHHLGVPCLLTGAGMAFPWELVRDAPLASGNIVEDMRLAVDLAAAGQPPVFEPTVTVTGELPSGGDAARAQRTRWEHGHLQTIAHVPRLLIAAIRRRQWRLVGLALELAVPPLSLLGLLWLVAVIAGAVWWVATGTSGPCLVLLTAATATAAAMIAAWFRYGRDLVPPAILLAAPWYAAAKLPIYFAFLFRRQRAWIRTPRATDQR